MAPTEGDGIEIVTVGGTSTDNAFVLGNPNDFGPFAVDIARGISLGNTESWFVVSPGYREEAAVLQAVTPFVEKLGYESVPRFHERRSYFWFPNKNTEQEAFWVRDYGSKFRLGLSGDAATRVDGYSGGMQVGTDIAAGGTKDNRHNFGLYAGVGYMQGDVAGLRSDTAGKLNDTALSIGLYATQHAPDKHFIEAAVQGSYHNLSIDYLTEPKKDVNLWSMLASLETGVSIPLSPCFKLQPQAQLMYQHTNGFDISTSQLSGNVSIADHDGLQGRLGFTGMFKSCEHNYNPFFELNLIKDFSEENRVTYAMNSLSDMRYAKDSVTLSSSPETLFLGGAIGISRNVSEKNNLSYFLKAEAMYGLDGLGSYDYKLIAGLRKTF
ncbi:MAG: autotransporter outer membrane beta-barrel domain-containing protein [Chlorobiaceae bacterium]